MPGLVVAAGAAVIIFLRDYRLLNRYPYLLFLAGITLLMLPLLLCRCRRWLLPSQRYVPKENEG